MNDVDVEHLLEGADVLIGSRPERKHTGVVHDDIGVSRLFGKPPNGIEITQELGVDPPT